MSNVKTAEEKARERAAKEKARERAADERNAERACTYWARRAFTHSRELAELRDAVARLPESATRARIESRAERAERRIVNAARFVESERARLAASRQ